MNRLERERLLMEHRLLARPRELPGRHVAEALIVALGLALRRLVLLAEMAAARLLAVQGVVAHQLGELEKVRHPTSVLERLVQLFAPSAHVDVFPELVAQPVDPPDRLLEPCSGPRHPALVPHHAAELAVEGIYRLAAARGEQATDPLAHFALDLAERRMLGIDLRALRRRLPWRAATRCPAVPGSRSSGTAVPDNSPAPPPESGAAAANRPFFWAPRCGRRCAVTRSST